MMHGLHAHFCTVCNNSLQCLCHVHHDVLVGCAGRCWPMGRDR